MYRVTSTTFIVITNGSTPTGNAFNFSHNFEAGKKYAVWYTQDGTTGKLYVNGSLASTLTVTLGPGTALSSSIYGFGSNNGLKQGIITEVAFYDKTVSATEIEDIYNKDIDFDDISDLYGWWRNTGNTNADWVDLSGNGNDGTVNGTPGTIWLPQGKEIGKDVVGMAQKYVNTGQLLTYNPTTHALVNDDNTLDFTTDFSIEAWIKPLQLVATMYFIDKPLAYFMSVLSTGKVNTRFYKAGSGIDLQSNATLNVNEYCHVVVTYDNSNRKIYINGVEDATASETGAIDVNTQNVRISATNAFNFKGNIDSVKFYNTALTADQVLQNYNAEKYKYI
jgi:hypothetical protein